MIHRIFQNLTGPSGYARPASEEAAYLRIESGKGAIDSVMHRIRVWLARVNRERYIEHESARAIAHLRDLSDSQLRDIGITRPDIERAVRGGRDEV